MKTTALAAALSLVLASSGLGAELTPLTQLVQQPDTPLVYLVKRCSAVTSVLAAQTGAAQGETSKRYLDIEKVAVYFTNATGSLIHDSGESVDKATADIGAFAAQYDDAIRQNHQAGGKLVADDYAACAVMYKGTQPKG